MIFNVSVHFLSYFVLYCTHNIYLWRSWKPFVHFLLSITELIYSQSQSGSTRVKIISQACWSNHLRWPWTHHEGIFHPDDGAVQDGGRHRGDLQQFALPALALALGQRISSQVGHQLLDLLAFALGEEGLVLIQRRLGHHDPRWTVLHLSEDLDGLAFRSKERRLWDGEKPEEHEELEECRFAPAVLEFVTLVHR